MRQSDWRPTRTQPLMRSTTWNATTAALLSLDRLGPGRASRAGRPTASRTTRWSGSWAGREGAVPQLQTSQGEWRCSLSIEAH